MQKLYQFVIMALFSSIVGCDFGRPGGDEELPLSTHILNVRVEPTSVAPGDTVTFTCVHTDSLQDRYNFSWFFQHPPGQSSQTVTTIENSVKWEAPSTPGTYRHQVWVDRRVGGFDSDTEAFTVEVTQ